LSRQNSGNEKDWQQPAAVTRPCCDAVQNPNIRFPSVAVDESPL